VFEQEEDASSRSFFSEIISSISDVRFSHDGRYIVSRDYLTVKIWDVNMERQPVKTIPIHEHLRPRLCDTYENDSIFDKFEVVFSGDAENVMTGSYNNNFMIYPTDEQKETEIVLQADKSAFKAKKVGVPTPMNKGTAKKAGSRSGSPAGPGSRMKKETDADQIDFNKKILHMSWHPFEDSIAIAATNNVSFISGLWSFFVTTLKLPTNHNSSDSSSSSFLLCKRHQVAHYIRTPHTMFLWTSASWRWDRVVGGRTDDVGGRAKRKGKKRTQPTKNKSKNNGHSSTPRFHNPRTFPSTLLASSFFSVSQRTHHSPSVRKATCLSISSSSQFFFFLFF
jgi:hypothetical protein